MVKREVGVLKLKNVIDWEAFRPVLEEVKGYNAKDWSKGGNPPFDPLLMFKMLIIQFYHGLSDESTENQIGDRVSFQSFLDLQMGDDIPDGNTIWDFKELIKKGGRDGSNKLFAKFHEILDQQNLIAKEGSTKGSQKDSDAR